MIPTPAQTLRRIMDRSLLPTDVVQSLNHDSILDARDGDAEFEAEWTRCYSEIEAKWPEANVARETAALSKDIRRESFLTVSRATNQHEIASYLRTDPELALYGRYVISGRLEEEGFQFQFPDLPEALRELLRPNGQ